MFTRKAMLLVGLTATALLSAVPASASAFEFADKGTPIGATKTITLGGSTSFAFEASGTVTCPTSAEADLEVKGAGKVKKYEFNPKQCARSGALSFCTVESITAKALPWTIGITGATTMELKASNIAFAFTFNTGCGAGEKTTVETGTITATGDTDTEWTEWGLSGKATSKEEPFGKVILGGSLGVTPISTYGIK